MSTSGQLDEMVARLQPVRDNDLAPESSSSDAEALFERIVAGASRDAESRADRSRRRGRWLIAVAAAALVGVVALLAIDLGPSPEVVTPAAAALRDVADAARAQDGIPPGRYLYVRSANASLAIGAVDDSDPDSYLDCCEVLVPQVREVWLGDEPGDARLRERRAGELEFLSEEERERWIQLGRPELAVKTPFSGILVGLPPQWYDGPLDLPTDADAIFEQFEEAAEQAFESNAEFEQPAEPFDVYVRQGMFQHFSDVLREARATPEQRAAAYEALARVPGLTLLGEVTDRLGRLGVAVALDILENEPTDHLYRYVLVFDPETADLLEERFEILPGNRYRGLAAGTVEAYATYEHAVVDALGERPRAR
jgi:hypothetical protein